MDGRRKRERMRSYVAVNTVNCDATSFLPFWAPPFPCDGEKNCSVSLSYLPVVPPSSPSNIFFLPFVCLILRYVLQISLLFNILFLFVMFSFLIFVFISPCFLQIFLSQVLFFYLVLLFFFNLLSFFTHSPHAVLHFPSL